MIYLALLKTYRWFTFIVFFVAIMYVGLQNSPGVQLPFKLEVLACFGFLIALHIGLLFFYGTDVKEVFMKMYFDNHYTIVMPNGVKRTVTEAVWREIQHEYDGVDCRIYYNNPSGEANFFKRVQ